MTTDPHRRPRYQVLDLARGAAIVMMVIFHVGWDLYYFGYSPVDVTTDPWWVGFQRLILSSFLLLAGTSLVLAHGERIRWRSFWRRFGVLCAAALLVTAGTYWMLPDYFVFFGVLHALALFSLLGLPFLRLPAWAGLAAAAVLLLLPLLFSDAVFEQRHLAWIGFWPTSPATADVVPIFPWFGILLLGIAGTRGLLASGTAPRLAAFSSHSAALRGLAFLGRWSLPFYLVHQPIIIGILSLLSQVQSPVLAPAVLTRAQSFLASCEQSCRAAGSTASQCEGACSCALDGIERADLWASIEAPAPSPAEAAEIDAVTRLCRAAPPP